MCSDKSVVLPFRTKFTSTVIQLNLEKRSHEKTGVKTQIPLISTDFPLIYWIQQLSRTWPGILWTRSSAAPFACAANQGNLLQKPVLAFHPGASGLLYFPEFAELHGRGWEIKKCPHYSLARLTVPPRARPALLQARARWWISIPDLIGRNRNKTKREVDADIQQRAGSSLLPFRDDACWQESKTGAGGEVQTKFSCLWPSVTLFLPSGVGRSLLWQIACCLA